MTNPQNKQCTLCLEEYKDGYSIHACNHDFCDTCFHTYIRTLIDTGSRRLEDFKCPQEKCDQCISEKELEKQLEFSMFNKITNRVVYEHTVMCPVCGQRSDFLNTEEFWFCFSCYTEICRFCKSLPHEGSCQDNVTYFNEVRATFQDNQDIGYCPECSVPFLKDENCDHVTCDNPDCGYQFCFGCSVTFSPIANHGGNFHRTDCRNYEYYDDYQPYYVDECSECVKLGTGCEPPTITKEYYLKELIQKIEGLQPQVPVTQQPKVQEPKVEELKVQEPKIEPTTQIKTEIVQIQTEMKSQISVGVQTETLPIQTSNQTTITLPQMTKLESISQLKRNISIELNQKAVQMVRRISQMEKKVKQEFERMSLTLTKL